MELKKIVPLYKKLKENLNIYIQRNVNDDEVRLSESMDISSATEAVLKVNVGLKEVRAEVSLNTVMESHKWSTWEYILKPSMKNDVANSAWGSVGTTVSQDTFELTHNNKGQGIVVSLNESDNFETYAITSINGEVIEKDFLSNQIAHKSKLNNYLKKFMSETEFHTKIFADNSSTNTDLIKDSFLNANSSLTVNGVDVNSSKKFLRALTSSNVEKINVSGNGNLNLNVPSLENISIISPPVSYVEPIVDGPYSMLHQVGDNLKNSDREFMNSVLSLSVYSSNDKWVGGLNEKLASGEKLSVDEVLKDSAMYSDSNDLDRVIAAYYATTFSPAKIMKNGKFEGKMGENGMGDFEFKDGVYRSNDNVCSASSMLSKNEDGTFTLHMTYRGTDNDSRTKGELSAFEKKHPSVKAFNSLMRFARYCVTAYSDMGRHHDNFTPFDKACLEFASNPNNNVKNIEVSGHSLGGAMVQRFLKSDALLNSDMKDKVQGMTWGAPQTNANILGKTLVVGKRLIEDTVIALTKVTTKSYVEYLTSTNVNFNDIESKNFKRTVAKTLFPPLIIANVAIDGVSNAVPTIYKFTKSVASVALNYSKKAVEVVASISNEFDKDVESRVKDYQADRVVKRAMRGNGGERDRKINEIKDAMHIAPDYLIAMASAVPKSIGPITRKLTNYWKDVGPVAFPESTLRQYAHDKDPIPLVTKLFASNVGNKQKLSNYVDKIPVWQQLVKNWDAPIDSESILGNEIKPKDKKYGLVSGIYKSAKILTSNFLGHLSTDKHNMRKYVINTMMKDSFFRRTNIHSENSRFDKVSVNDEKWLSDTPNISKFEGLLHSVRLENMVFEDARSGTQFRDFRKMEMSDFAERCESDRNGNVSSHMNKTLHKLEKLYGDKIPCVSADYAKAPDFSDCANESFIIFNRQKTEPEKLKALSDGYVQDRKGRYLARELDKVKLIDIPRNKGADFSHFAKKIQDFGANGGLPVTFIESKSTITSISLNKEVIDKNRKDVHSEEVFYTKLKK